MEKYAETDTKKLSKLIPEITDILLEKANRSMEFSDFEKKIIFSVMRPEESSNIVAAVIAMCKDGNAIAELLGYNSLDEIGSNKEILKQFMSVASEISGLDEKEVSDNDKHLALLVLAAARDILIAVNSSEGKDKTDLINKLNDESLKPSQIEAYLVKSKAVNMNVIVESVTKTDDNTFSVDNENFEIDIQALQRAVEDKNAIAEAERKIKEKDWGAILDMDNFKRGRKEYVPIAFMKLSDIKAVAASA